MFQLKYLSNFWRALEMSQINCEIAFQLKRSGNCILVAGENPGFQINYIILYVLFETLSTQLNIELLQ